MGVQMDKTSIIACSVIGVVGLLSAIFGFSAEGTKLNAYNIQLTVDYDCFFPPNPAVGLGICAAIFLLLSQVIISVVGGCCGCCKSRAIPSETKKMVGIICAVFSWIAAVIAMALFISGASANTTGVRSLSECKVVKEGIFAGAGILALVATALGITSFIMLRQPAVQAPTAPDTSATATPNNMPGGYAQSPSPGVVVGQPLLPLPPSNKPQPPNDYPVKPHQAYQYQQQYPHQAVAPTHHQSTSHHPQGYYVQNMQAPPAAAQPAQQHNVSYAPNHQQQQQQHLPPRPAPAPAAGAVAFGAAAASAAPGVLQQPAVAMVPVNIPGALPGTTALPAAGSGLGLPAVVGHEVARQGVRMAAQVMAHALFSSDSNPVADCVPDSAGGAGGDAV